jgi:serine/threonine-protein kinase
LLLRYTQAVEEVGRYRVTRRVGAGGMAEVFEGVALGSAGFSRRVAIKRMRPEAAADGSGAFGRMFLDEARIASQLHHANIASVLDYGVADGAPFQVLEFVDGVDAGRLYDLSLEAGAPLPAALALAICTDIAHALDHAHRAASPSGGPLGIVHRDVKPGNILVSWSGDVKLVDFGIAFANAGVRLESTSAGLTKGTLLYMAPEQIMRGAVDGRTDLFALGCVLHALVTGASPLAREGAMADLVAGVPLAISRALPDDIHDIVARATRLARAERYPDAATMASALGTALSRRIDRDARSIMREHLARLAPAPPSPPPAGKLDALLGGELVFSGLRSADRPAVAPAPPAPPGAPPLEAGPELDVPPRRHGALWVGLGAPILAVVAAVAVWTPSEPTPAAASAGIIDAMVTAPPRDATSLVSPPVIDAASRPPELPDAPSRRPDPGPKPPPRRPPMPPPPVPTAEPAGEPAATGVIAIGGDGALRAEILVDGASHGFAPRRLVLPAGSHEVILVRPDGTRLSRRLQVGAAHTSSAPLRWTVDAPPEER